MCSSSRRAYGPCFVGNFFRGERERFNSSRARGEARYGAHDSYEYTLLYTTNGGGVGLAFKTYRAKKFSSAVAVSSGASSCTA